MLGCDALGPALAGKAQHRSEGGRGQVVAPAVVLGASPAGPDGHHLEADEAPLLPVEAGRAQELHIQAALLTAWLLHVLKAPDRPVSLLHSSGPAFQADGDHVAANRRHAAGQCRVLDRARRERRSLSAHVVEEMEPGESLDEGPRHLVRPAGLDFAGQELPCLILGKPGKVLVPSTGPAPVLRRVRKAAGARVLTFRTSPPSGKNRSARFRRATSSGSSPENLRPSALSRSQFCRASRSLRATNLGSFLFQEARNVPSAVVA